MFNQDVCFGYKNWGLQTRNKRSQEWVLSIHVSHIETLYLHWVLKPALLMVIYVGLNFRRLIGHNCVFAPILAALQEEFCLLMGNELFLLLSLFFSHVWWDISWSLTLSPNLDLFSQIRRILQMHLTRSSYRLGHLNHSPTGALTLIPIAIAGMKSAHTISNVLICDVLCWPVFFLLHILILVSVFLVSGGSHLNNIIILELVNRF